MLNIFFWYFLEKEAACVIEDLSREPFQAYCKALELNGESFHHRSFGYPTSESHFINPESAKYSRDTLAVWQRKYDLCYTAENLKPLSFDEWSGYSHNDFFPNIAAYILKMPETLTFKNSITFRTRKKTKSESNIFRVKNGLVTVNKAQKALMLPKRI